MELPDLPLDFYNDQDWISTSFIDAMSILGGPEFLLMTAGDVGANCSPVGNDSLFLAEDISAGSMLLFGRHWKRDFALADSVGAM